MAQLRFLPRGRCLFLIGLAVLLCFIALAGCTQPVIPSPAPVPITSAPAAPTGAPVPPVAPTSQVTAREPDYLTYTNSQYGFTMSYPSGWTKQENTGSSVVTFTAPSSGVGDLPATMRVTVEDLTANPMSLDQFRAAQLAKKNGLESFNLIYDQAAKGTGYSGWKVGYTYNTGTLMEGFEVYAIRGASAFTLTFISRMDRFAAYSVQSDTMFKSFQLTG
ncbi:MAG TPA: hypothetical protein VLU98_01730 [Methanomicrobiales archaeon]|nr:hypothetical protein [Methanomicrobiales archaeon]